MESRHDTSGSVLLLVILPALPSSMPGFILHLVATWLQWFQRHILTQQCSKEGKRISPSVSLLGEGNLFQNPPPPLQLTSPS